MTRTNLMLFSSAFFLSGCFTWKNGTDHELSDGFYTKLAFEKRSTVYAKVTGDTIRLYPAIMQNNNWSVEPTAVSDAYWQGAPAYERSDFKLSRSSFDIDFLTIPVKIRPSAAGVSPQLNTSLNGAIYLGFRNDNYRIGHRPDPLKVNVRHITHFGHSFGLFTGFGNTFMSPTNTHNRLQQEYDGMVWNKGVAGIIGMNNLTIGLAVGFDDLLDRHSTIWIYQEKPWVGFAFGLNLN